jgi:hypothetical protein
MMIFEDEVSCYERMDDRERAGFIPRAVTLYFSFRPGDVSSGEDVFIEVIIENSHEIISREPSTRNVMRMIDACVSRVYYSNLTDEIICKILFIVMDRATSFEWDVTDEITGTITPIMVEYPTR